MAKKQEQTDPASLPASSRQAEAEIEYDRLNKLFQKETDSVKKEELGRQCDEALKEKLKNN